MGKWVNFIRNIIVGIICVIIYSLIFKFFGIEIVIIIGISDIITRLYIIQQKLNK